MRFETASTSLLGNREVNQDRCLALSDGNCVLLLLSDGLGGHPKGDVAAQLLIETGRRAFAAVSKPIADPQGFLEDIQSAAHEEILAYGRRHQPPITPRATAVLALVQNSDLFWSHTGDSRLYLFRGYHVILRTQDHSLLEAMRTQGIPLDSAAQPHYRNLVTQCLGGTRPGCSDCHNPAFPLLPRDILLLCTDGLWSQFADEALSSHIRHHGSLERMTTELAHAAELSAAPQSDNITLIVLRWLGNTPSGTLPEQPLRALTALETAADSEDPELREAIVNLLSALDEFSSKDT